MDRKLPKLSVIMPIYNAEKWLRRGVDSVLNQTFTDLELILVNDGSKDNSLKICKEYEVKDNRVIVIDKENEGAGPTRNSGIEVARGKYLAFPDSDDFLEPNAYEIAIDKIEEENVDLLVFGINIYVYTENEERHDYIKVEKPTKRICKTRQECRDRYVEFYKNVNMHAPWNKIYKSSVIKGNGVRFPDLRRMQDCVFNANYYDKINSVMLIDDVLYDWSWHTQEIQKKKMPKGLINCAIEYHKTVSDMLERWGLWNSQNIECFDQTFNSNITVAEFFYAPENNSLRSIYKHVKSINNNSYVHSFYKRIKGIRKLSKKELVMYLKFNLLISLYLWIKNKKGR